MSIKLKDIFPMENPKDYKVHFAKWNGENQPLDVFVNDRQEWQTWQEYRAKRNDFNRLFIFSLARFYHEPDTWLFGGVFRVVARGKNKYNVELTDLGSGFIGRLKLRSPYNSRLVRVKMELQYSNFEVAEILPEPFSGRPFPRYEEIDISFAEMETIVRNTRSDWKAALENVKGIYLITNIKTGKRYVGSARGLNGVWSRWCSYVQTGHGGNVELRALVGNPNLEYCRKHFRFALLEHRPALTGDDVILARETFWKNLLLSRGEQGLNRN